MSNYNNFILLILRWDFINTCTFIHLHEFSIAAKQCYVLEYNLLSTMKKDSPREKYNGYGACPLVTSYNTCILAEFIYGSVPHETFPFNQVCSYFNWVGSSIDRITNSFMSVKPNKTKFYNLKTCCNCLCSMVLFATSVWSAAPIPERGTALAPLRGICS